MDKSVRGQKKKCKGTEQGVGYTGRDCVAEPRRGRIENRCPSTEEWIKKMWYLYIKAQYSAIKRNKTVSFVEMWMDLGNIIQTEVHQKEKNKYHILTHMCRNQKHGTDDLIWKVETETQMQRTNSWIPRGKGVGKRNQEIGIDIFTLLTL